MTVRGTVTGLLSTSAVGGLALIASGVVDWGVRAVALFTLLGFAWLAALIVFFGVELHNRTVGR